MMKKLGLLVALSIAQFFWLWMIARQHNFLLVGASIIFIVLLTWCAVGKSAAPKSLYLQVGLGVISGYIASIASGFVSECSLRGWVCYSNFVTSNLYFFPAASFGWLYGGLLFFILGAGKKDLAID